MSNRNIRDHMAPVFPESPIRRALLRASASAGILALSGCGGADDATAQAAGGSPAPQSPTPSPSPSPSPSPTPTPTPPGSPPPPAGAPPPPAGQVAVGSLAHDGPATPEQISLWLPVTGALPQSAVATCRYRVSPSGTWIAGHPLYRVQPAAASAPTIGGPIQDGFAWVIIDLQPGTTYDVEVAVTQGSNSVTKTLTHTTRALPGASGPATVNIAAGATAAAIQGAINTAPAGAVVQFANGTYNLGDSSVVIDHPGPLTIRGQSRSGVVINRGGTSGTKVAFLLRSASVGITIEDMTLVGPGLQLFSAPFASDSGIDPKITNLTIRRVTSSGFSGCVGMANAEGMLIYDCRFTGIVQWTDPWIGSAPLSWSYDGIQLCGKGNCAFNNTLTGFCDAFAVVRHEGNIALSDTYGIHIYRNDVNIYNDDAVEVDYARRNITLYDNRFRNGANMFSLDPLHGGPFICARNTYFNLFRGRAGKVQGDESGFFMYNNTVVLTANAEPGAFWYNSGASGSWQMRYFAFRNNLVVNKAPSLPADYYQILHENRSHDPVDWTHNSWYPDARFRWSFEDGNFGNLAAAQAASDVSAPIFSTATRKLVNDNLVTANPWNETVAMPASHLTPVTADYRPTLAAGNAKNTGVVIPNITDGFSGAAPDRGSSIAGRAAVAYGDRS